MTGKSPEAFRTISEVAEEVQVPAHVLRFWESRFAQIRPVKRAGGRRYYRPDDVELIGGIKRLLHDHGMTIRGVQKLLKDHGVAHVAAMGTGHGPVRGGDGRSPFAPPPPAFDPAALDQPFDAAAPDPAFDPAGRHSASDEGPAAARSAAALAPEPLSAPASESHGAPVPHAPPSPALAVPAAGATPSAIPAPAGAAHAAATMAPVEHPAGGEPQPAPAGPEPQPAPADTRAGDAPVAPEAAMPGPEAEDRPAPAETDPRPQRDPGTPSFRLSAAAEAEDEPLPAAADDSPLSDDAPSHRAGADSVLAEEAPPDRAAGDADPAAPERAGADDHGLVADGPGAPGLGHTARTWGTPLPEPILILLHRAESARLAATAPRLKPLIARAAELNARLAKAAASVP